MDDIIDVCLFVFTKLIPLNILCRCLSDISKERYDHKGFLSPNHSGFLLVVGLCHC